MRPEVDASVLVARAGTGDEQAWRELVDRYSGRVFAMIQSRVRNQAESEDMTQAVFVKLVEQVSEGKYREERRFEPWLFRIAMNLVRDRVRRASSGPMVVQGVHDNAGPPTSDETDEFARLRDALETLPDPDREVLSLRHSAGLGFKEIAAALGEPMGTLLARHHRALAKLREALEPRREATS